MLDRIMENASESHHVTQAQRNDKPAMSVRSLLGTSNQLFRDNYKILLRITAMLYGPYLLAFFLLNIVAPSFFPGNGFGIDGFGGYWLWDLSGVTLFVGWIVASLYWNAAIIDVVVKEYNGDHVVLEDAIHSFILLWKPIIKTKILALPIFTVPLISGFVFVFVMFGAIFSDVDDWSVVEIILAVTGVSTIVLGWMAYKCFLYINVVVAEGSSGFQAFKRSSELMKGDTKPKVCFLVQFILVYILGIIALELIPFPRVVLLLEEIFDVAFYLSFSIGSSVLYCTARSKLEQTTSVLPRAEAAS